MRNIIAVSSAVLLLVGTAAVAVVFSTSAAAANVAACEVVATELAPADAELTARNSTLGRALASCSLQSRAPLLESDAFAMPGDLGVFASTGGEGPCSGCFNVDSHFTSAQASFEDTITAHGRAGLGTVTVIVGVDGGQVEDVRNSITTEMVGGLLTSLIGKSESCFVVLTGRGTFDETCSASAPIDFSNAPVFTVSELLTTTAGTPLLSFGDLADFAHTADVREIEFFDSDGKPLTDVTVTSGSGATYRVGPFAVSEPPSVLLLAAALAGVIGRRMRRRAGP